VLVTKMTTHLVLRWPAKCVILASDLRTLPWSGMSFLVLGKITRSLEAFATSKLAAAQSRFVGSK
jgi:hypothetical protein